MPKALKQFIKYFVVGSSGVVLDLSILAFLKELLGLPPWIAVSLSLTIVIAYNFTLNKHWSFRNKELPHWQFVRYMSLAGMNYVIGVGLMYVFNEMLGYQYLLVRVGSILLSVAWNFLLYKFWVFPEESNENVIHNTTP